MEVALPNPVAHLKSLDPVRLSMYNEGWVWVKLGSRVRFRMWVRFRLGLGEGLGLGLFQDVS